MRFLKHLLIPGDRLAQAHDRANHSCGRRTKTRTDSAFGNIEERSCDNSLHARRALLDDRSR